jgi:hypothetical protein
MGTLKAFIDLNLYLFNSIFIVFLAPPWGGWGVKQKGKVYFGSYELSLFHYHQYILIIRNYLYQLFHLFLFIPGSF